MNKNRQFLQSVDSLAQAIKAKSDSALIEALSEETSNQVETLDASPQIFRSHCACEQG